MGKRPAPPVASSVVLLGRPGAGCTSLLHALAVAAEESGKGGAGGGGGNGGAPPRTGKGHGVKASAAVDGSGVTIRRLTVGGLLLDMMDVGALDQMHAVFRKNGLSATAVIYTLDASSPSSFAAAATDLRRLFIGDRAAKTTIFPDVPLVLAINRIPDGAPPQATGEYVRRLRVDDLPVRALHAVAIDSGSDEHPGVHRALAVLAAEVRRAREASLVS